MARTGRRREGEDRIVEVGGETAGPETAVEGKKAEGVLGAAVEVGRTAVDGVETPPDGVVIEAGGAGTDVVAHDIGVGTGIPTEDDTAVFDLDSQITKDIVDRVAAVDGVFRVRVIK